MSNPIFHSIEKRRLLSSIIMSSRDKYNFGSYGLLIYAFKINTQPHMFG